MPTVHADIPFEAYRGEQPYIFVSYSHQDSDLVFNEIKRLHEAGYRIWYDEGISPTQEWSEEIAEALEKSALFLYFVSPRSVKSKNCRDEAFFALDMSKPFLAVYVEETQVPSGLKLRTNSIQAVMKYQLSTSTYEKRLERALEPFALRGVSSERERRELAAPPETVPTKREWQTLKQLTPQRILIALIGFSVLLVVVIWLTYVSRKTDGSLSSQVNTTASPTQTPALSNTPITGNNSTPGNATGQPTPNEPLPPVGGIIGADDAIKMSEVKAPYLRAAASAVGQILIMKDGQQFTCTAFLVRNDLVLTAAVCVEGMDSPILKMGEENEADVYKIETTPVEIVSDADGLNFALLRVSGDPGSKHAILRLATSGPAADEALSIIMFRSNGKFVVTKADDCKVFSVEDSVFNHRCDTGPGTTGSPILSADATKVFGIHFKRDAQGGLAARADKILSRSSVLRSK